MILIVLSATLLAALVVFAAVWWWTADGDDVSLIDAFWGPGFVLLGWLGWLIARPSGVLPVVFLAAITVWAARLSWHMRRKHHRIGTEDRRYRAMRVERGEAFRSWSLPNIFLLQAAILWLVATPLQVANLSGGVPALTGLVAMGLVVFAVGFTIEWIADNQLEHFKADPGNATRVFYRGLWGFSRHPNYFGETVLWWGLGLSAYGLAGGGLVASLAFIGPALLTVLILKVSGVAMVEPLLARDKPDYAAYKERVSAFIPWPRSTPAKR
ncbi:MAG: DUF1295 domain-containing protein [Alphaproteobacteria bacterium]